jgi:hypothetical protein
MAIFPSQVQYINQKDQGLINFMNAWYMENSYPNQQFWGEANTDALFESGNQWAYNSLYGNFIPPRQQSFYFNRCRPAVNLIDGYQRQNRKSIIAVPTGVEGQKTADQLTKTLFWVNRYDNMSDTFSDAFRGACVTGLSLLQLWLDYSSDPISGDLRMTNHAYNSVLMDAFFTKMDLSDCSGIWKRSFLTHIEAIALCPDYAEEIANIQVEGNSPDGKFQFMPENYAYSQQNLLTYDEFYYRDYRKQKKLVDPNTGMQLEWRGSEEGLKLALLDSPQLKVIENTLPTVNLAIVIQGHVIYNGRNPLGIDRYPFVPVVAYFNPQIPDFSTRIQGLVRSMRSPQFLYNRFLINMSDALEAQFNTGFFFKENSLINPADLWKTGPGQNIGIKQGASMDDIRKMPPAEISQGMFTLSQVFADEVFKDSGITEELMGVAANDISGFHTMLKQSAGLVGLQPILDRADTSLKLLGELQLELIQNNFVPGKIREIVGEESTEEFYSKAFRKYDIAVEEGYNTTTQKQMQASQLLHLRQNNIPIPDELIIKALNLQNKNDIIELMKQQQQQAIQMQQQQVQSQMQESQARTQLAQARAAADEGLGIERLSRVEENQALAVERRAQAERDHYSGMLDMVKTLKELEQLDINQVEKLLLLARIIKEKEESPLQEPESGYPVMDTAEEMNFNPNTGGL